MRHSIAYLLLRVGLLSCFCLLSACSDEGFESGDTTYLSAPTGLRTSVSGFNITLYWTSVSHASHYNVYYSQISSNGPWTLVDRTSNTSIDLTAYSAGTFYFVVTAVNNNYEESSYSSPAYCVIQSSGGGNGSGGDGGGSGNGGGNNGGSTTKVPPAPTGLSGSRQGPATYSYVYLSWNYTSGADSYVIYRSTSANGTYSQIGTSYSCSYSDENYKSGNNYYKVAAKNSAGVGPKSDYCLVSINNDSYKPDFSSIKGTASGNKLTFTWKAKSGTGYGTPDKVTLSYYLNITNSQRQLQTKEFTGSQALSGSYSFDDCRYMMDSYNKVQVQFTIANSNGQNSRTITYVNGSFTGTF